MRQIPRSSFLVLAVVLLCTLLCADAALSFKLGERLPITIYMRNKRQTRSTYLRGGEAANANPADAEMTAMQKHSNQEKILLPPALHPHFAVDTVSNFNVSSWMTMALQQMLQGSTLQQSDAALRLQVGRGINRETTWLPLMIRQDKAKSLGLQNPASPGSPERLLALRGVRFSFGYQKGDFHSMTNCHVDYDYAPVQTGVLVLTFTWAEHRAFNPTRALTACSVVVLLAALLLIASMTNGRGKTVQRFRRQTVSVRSHKNL